mmetsp:Transcript_44414/g.110040  ORF Transcript_44414/g.110040 Transcript_44414/m.110040 type:complete len:308 (+) Transcript_44414:437-1360(+)
MVLVAATVPSDGVQRAPLRILHHGEAAPLRVHLRPSAPFAVCSVVELRRLVTVIAHPRTSPAAYRQNVPTAEARGAGEGADRSHLRPERLPARLACVQVEHLARTDRQRPLLLLRNPWQLVPFRGGPPATHGVNFSGAVPGRRERLPTHRHAAAAARPKITAAWRAGSTDAVGEVEAVVDADGRALDGGDVRRVCDQGRAPDQQDASSGAQLRLHPHDCPARRRRLSLARLSRRAQLGHEPPVLLAERPMPDLVCLLAVENGVQGAARGRERVQVSQRQQIEDAEQHLVRQADECALVVSSILGSRA